MLTDLFREEMLSDCLNGVAPLVVQEKLMKYKQSGMDKDTMYDVLDSLRLEMHQNGNKKAEDIILEYMDFVIGWCNPKLSIFP